MATIGVCVFCAETSVAALFYCLTRMNWEKSTEICRFEAGSDHLLYLKGILPMEKDTLQKLKEDIKYEILTELGLWLNSENALKTHGTINERIRNLRKMKGINQEMMARNIGMNRTTYARYEEKGNYAIDDIFKIADYLNISAEYIIFGITAEKTTN